MVLRDFSFLLQLAFYPQYRQKAPDIETLRERDAYPADPEEGYGWEKLYMEKLCQYYRIDYGLGTRIARFHNVYGPLGTYEGSKEKAPAAIRRKVALAANGREIELWGDSRQTRSFMYVDDCLEGIYRIMRSDYQDLLTWAGMNWSRSISLWIWSLRSRRNELLRNMVAPNLSESGDVTVIMVNSLGF